MVRNFDVKVTFNCLLNKKLFFVICVAMIPGGVLEVYMMGGPDVFFWVENLHAQYFFGSRDLSCIFLGLKKIRVLFWVLSPSELFVSGCCL